MNRRGRKTKYKQEIVDNICKWLSAGNTRRTAFTLAGIGESTFYDYLNNYPEFSEAIKRAEEQAIARNVQIINKAGQTSWQASAWWLERRCKEDFGKQDRIDLTTNGKDIRTMSLSELEAEIERLKIITAEAS
jgi:hypothetical protein